jgi:hypothetical protein
MLFTSIVLAGLFLPGVSASAQKPSARIWADSSSYVVGDPIRIHVRVDHAQGTALTVLPGDSMGLSILEPLTLQPAQDTGSSGFLVVAGYDSGRAVFPPISFLAASGETGTADTIRTNPLSFTIQLVDVDTSAGIRDLKPPVSLPLTLAEITVWAGIVIGIAALGYTVFRLWKKWHERRGTLPAYTPPPKPAHVIALEELGMLKEQKLWQKGLVKEYYSRLTEIIRTYFENRYGFMAMEQTTDEILAELRRHPGAEAAWNEAEDVLRSADLVKFAKHMPSMSSHEGAMKSAYTIVDVTRTREHATSVTAGEEQKDHVVV